LDISFKGFVTLFGSNNKKVSFLHDMSLKLGLWVSQGHWKCYQWAG